MSYFRHPQSILLRRVLFQIHLWTGIGAGLYIVVVCVTGSALVFREEINQSLHPDLYDVSKAEGQASIPDVIRSVKSAYPSDAVAGVYSPTPRRAAFLVYVYRNQKYVTVVADPSTGKVLGELPETGFLRWLQDLHFNLLAGSTGRMVNGVGALLLALLCLTG